MKNSKKAIESLSIQTKMVLPQDTNPLNTLFGGSLLADEVQASQSEIDIKPYLASRSL